MSKISRFIKRQKLAGRKALWGAFRSHVPDSSVVYILGAQRSGTTLLLFCLEKSMEFDVLGESSKAMVNYRIRSDEEIRQIVRSSHHKIVVFKPLTDSHRSREFLELMPNSKAIWAFRRVEDRANSAVAKFGDHNLQILSELSKGAGKERWQAQGLTDELYDFIRSFDYSNMLPETASALFWYVRNSLFFSSGLEDSDEVLPLAYEDLVSDPGRVMQGVCRFVGGEFKDSMVRDVHAKSIGRSASKVPQHIQDICTPLYERLHKVQARRWNELKLGD
jgi:hypothetical protein